DRLDDRGRAGLELVGRLAIDDAVLEYFPDHLAAAVERRHGLEVLVFSVEHADAAWAIKLVTGQRIEVAADILHVDVEVNGGLGTIEQYRNAARMGAADHLFDWHHSAQHVRHVGDRHHPGARREQTLELVEEKVTVVVDRRPFDHRTLALAQE